MSKSPKSGSGKETGKGRYQWIDHIRSVDFATLADDVSDRDQWLVEPLIPAHRLTAIVAGAGVGKSLIMLEVAAALATGAATLLRQTGPPVSVVYIDMEMAPDDLAERLDSLGYDYAKDESLQENLHYYQMQSFEPFDTQKGGKQLRAVVGRDGAELVVIDTLARAVEGNENEANTYHAFARFTGIPLKVDGVTVVRLDHLGKDATKGSRGSSAKRDDVDVSWVMLNRKSDPSTITFRVDKARPAWIPSRADVTRMSGPPLRHEIRPDELTAKAAELVAHLDELGLPNSAGRDKARKAIKEAGIQGSTEHLADAVAARRRRGGQPKKSGS